jgi:hypothetical protein
MSAIFGLGTRTVLSGRFRAPVALPSIHWIERLVDPRDGLDAVKRRKSLALTGNRNSVLQPVARPYNY